MSFEIVLGQAYITYKNFVTIRLHLPRVRDRQTNRVYKHFSNLLENFEKGHFLQRSIYSKTAVLGIYNIFKIILMLLKVNYSSDLLLKSYLF